MRSKCTALVVFICAIERFLLAHWVREIQIRAARTPQNVSPVQPANNVTVLFEWVIGIIWFVSKAIRNLISSRVMRAKYSEKEMERNVRSVRGKERQMGCGRKRKMRQNEKRDKR